MEYNNGQVASAGLNACIVHTFIINHFFLSSYKSLIVVKSYHQVKKFRIGWIVVTPSLDVSTQC